MPTPTEKTSTDYMVKLFMEAGADKKLFPQPPSLFMHFFQPKEIKNPDRMWFQFWKPKMIDNPHYQGILSEDKTIEFDIVRGNK